MLNPTYAAQGVRRKVTPVDTSKKILEPGDEIKIFDAFDDMHIEGTWKHEVIEAGTIGIVHAEEGTISVVRDDCQAARRARKEAAGI